MENFEAEENLQQAQEVHPPDMFAESSAINAHGETWNPRLHILLHSIVLGQLDEVPKVKEVYQKLQEEFGLHPHSAIHAISGCLAEEIALLRKNQEAYQSERHEKKLDELVDPDSERHLTNVDPLTHGDYPQHPERN